MKRFCEPLRSGHCPSLFQCLQGRDRMLCDMCACSYSAWFCKKTLHIDVRPSSRHGGPKGSDRLLYGILPSPFQCLSGKIIYICLIPAFPEPKRKRPNVLRHVRFRRLALSLLPDSARRQPETRRRASFEGGFRVHGCRLSVLKGEILRFLNFFGGLLDQPGCHKPGLTLKESELDKCNEALGGKHVA